MKVMQTFYKFIWKSTHKSETINSLLHHAEIWERVKCVVLSLQPSLSPPDLPKVSSGPQTGQGHCRTTSFTYITRQIKFKK